MLAELQAQVAQLVDEVRTLKAQVAWLKDCDEGPPPDRDITDADRETLRALIRFRRSHNCGPTTAELGRMLEITDKAAQWRLIRMRRKGLVSPSRQGDQSRSTRALYDPDAQDPGESVAC